MRIAIACLVALIPVMALASANEPKDKYLNCNCQLTPGIPWKGAPAAATAPAEHHVVHHKHKAAPKIASATPAPVVHHHKKIVTEAHDEAPVVSTTGDAYPGREAIVSSNKLALPAGKSVYAPGQLVYISGRVLDMHCVPVSDAIVDIWQANPEGKYVKTTLGERLSPAPVFTGSGRATTDNLGRFNFVTVFPGASGSRAPYIHVHVVHKSFPTLDTEMFFADDRRNQSDPVFSSLSPQQREKITAKVWERDESDPDKGLAASLDISLNGKNPWRHF